MTYASKHIEGLPYQSINALLSLTLKHGTVHLSDKTIQHIRERHSKDYDLCLTSIDTIVTAPDFIGQEPHHLENFEVVKRIGEVMVLVAIGSVPNEYGKYPVLSSYIIPHNAMQRRLRKGHLAIHK
jgi:hypothetical protein